MDDHVHSIAGALPHRNISLILKSYFSITAISQDAYTVQTHVLHDKETYALANSIENSIKLSLLLLIRIEIHLGIL